MRCESHPLRFCIINRVSDFNSTCNPRETTLGKFYFGKFEIYVYGFCQYFHFYNSPFLAFIRQFVCGCNLKLIRISEFLFCLFFFFCSFVGLSIDAYLVICLLVVNLKF